MDIDKRIAESLEGLREDPGEKAVAFELGLDRTTVTKIRRGQRRAPASILPRLAGMDPRFRTQLVQVFAQPELPFGDAA